MMSDDELDQLEGEKLLLSSNLNATDIRRVNRMWAQRKRLIHELRRMNVLMDQIVRCSCAALEIDLYAPRQKRS